MENESFHSLCRWTFNPGRGGFTPSDARPGWAGDNLGPAGFIRLAADRIKPLLPGNITLGVELHYDSEVDEKSAPEIASALSENNMHLAMITPGAHSRRGYGGVSSLEAAERKAAEEFCLRTVDLACGPLRKSWHPDPSKYPSLVLWNGSWGYDPASAGVRGKEKY